MFRDELFCIPASGNDLVIVFASMLERCLNELTAGAFASRRIWHERARQVHHVAGQAVGEPRFAAFHGEDKALLFGTMFNHARIGSEEK